MRDFLGEKLEKLSLARAARKIVVQYLQRADDPSALVEIEPVGVAGYRPDHHVLHEGRIGRLGPKIADLTTQLREEMELRSALVIITGIDTKPQNIDRLSPKEVLYLDMICDGLTDIEAAGRLSISLRAIKTRKKAICDKTQSTTINHAIAKYMRAPRTRHAPPLTVAAERAVAQRSQPKNVARRLSKLAKKPARGSLGFKHDIH